MNNVDRRIPEPIPVGDLTFWQKIGQRLSKIGFNYCGYCGKGYVKCHSKNINIFMPVPQNGYACPDGHEGFVDEFMGWGMMRNHFDFVADFERQVQAEINLKKGGT